MIPLRRNICDYHLIKWGLSVLHIKMEIVGWKDGSGSRAHTALAEDQSSVFIIHIRLLRTSYNSSSRRSYAFFWFPRVVAQTWHTPTEAHTHINKNLKLVLTPKPWYLRFSFVLE